MRHTETDGFESEEEDEGSELEFDLDSFDKDRLVRAHELQRCAHLHMFANVSGGSTFGISFTRAATDQPASPSAPLRALRPMLVRNLQVGCRHKGRVLYGELCVEPLKMVSVETILVDESGHATKLSIYNALPRQHDVQKMGILFPKGLKVAIKEPYFKIAMDGTLIIRVDNPADVVRNPSVSRSSGSRNVHALVSSLSSASLSSPSSLSHDQSRMLLDARALRNEGGRAFASQDWKHAIQLYTDAVRTLLQSQDKSSPSSSSSSSSPSPASSSSSSSSAVSSSLEVTKELVLVFSNRAEARLRLKHFEAAEIDASRALQLQKNHVKSLFRKGRALHGLHHYKEAILCFSEALQIANEEKGMSVKELTSAVEASKICEEQARTGKYNLLKMWREVEQGREPLCGEYVGPVRIGPPRDIALGRGLLVTRDVEPGDLLLVSKAVAQTSSSSEGLSEQEIKNACTGSESSSPVSRVYQEDLFLQVLDRAMSSKRFREQVYNLSPTDRDGIENDIPPINLFAPKLTSTGSHDLFSVEDYALDPDNVDMERVREVTRTNAFEVPGESAAMLWLLPSFINHSCSPNAYWMRVGKEALFVRAVRHLKKGQEVTISYLDKLTCCPWFVRAQFLGRYRGFECRCEKCSFEKTMQPFMKQLERKVALHPVEDINLAVEMVESLEWAFQNITAFEDQEKKQWMRTSFSPCYTLILDLDGASLQQRFKDMQLLEVNLRAVQETLGGSEGLLIMMRQRGHLENCSPHARELVARMYVCLYGKQAPADLRSLVVLRHYMIVNAAQTMNAWGFRFV